jgi:hypothetical protein
VSHFDTYQDPQADADARAFLQFEQVRRAKSPHVPLERDPRQAQLFPVERSMPAARLRTTKRQAAELGPLFGGDEGKQTTL